MSVRLLMPEEHAAALANAARLITSHGPGRWMLFYQDVRALDAFLTAYNEAWDRGDVSTKRTPEDQAGAVLDAARKAGRQSGEGT